MLKPAEMKGFRAVILKSKRDEVLAALHEAGVVQFREVTPEELEKEELEEEFYEVNSVLGEMKELQEFLDTASSEASAEIGEESLTEFLDFSKDLLQELGPKCDELASKTREIQEEREELMEQRAVLSDLKEVEVPLNYLQSTENIEIIVGQIDEDELDDFMKSTKEVLPPEVFIASSGLGGTRIVVLACRKETVPDLRPLLYRFGVESLELPRLDQTPRESIEDLNEKVADLEEKERKIGKQIEELRQEKAPEINTLVEHLEIERERQECLPFFGKTDSTTVIEGWAPKGELQEAREAIEESTDESFIMRTYEPSGDDASETPVKLENPRFAEPHEYLTEMYDLPKYDSTDPTLIVAISFSLFFGFTLSDAGYGILVLALFLSGLPFVKGMFSKRLRHVMIAGAIGTIIVGALFGSWFGRELGQHFSIFSPIWVDPVFDTPIPFLKLVIFVGVLQLAVGYGIARGRTDIIRKNWKGVIFDDIGNALLTIGLFLLVFCVLGMGLRDFGIGYNFPEVDLFVAFIPSSGGPLSLRISQGIFFGGLFLAMVGRLTSKEAPLQERMGGAVNVLYSIITLISNAASYTRLLALGVATSVIAFVINYIGFMFYTAVFPASFTGVSSYVFAIVSVVALVVILVFGHIFNIFINSITGFVHTMRLHYAEFFETFYESGGEEYSPFKLIRKYT